MPTYLALFRGINVSGKNIIKMEELRKLMETAGYGNVLTFIQSGNVIFDSSNKSKTQLADELEALIKENYGYSINIFIIDTHQLEEAVNNNPFERNRQPEDKGSKTLYVTLLSKMPLPEEIERLKMGPIGDDKIEVIDNILYFKLQTKASESKLSNNFIESKLKCKATTRNWNTTLNYWKCFKTG